MCQDSTQMCWRWSAQWFEVVCTIAGIGLQNCWKWSADVVREVRKCVGSGTQMWHRCSHEVMVTTDKPSNLLCRTVDSDPMKN
jgi:hypothetical protein